MYLGLIYLIYNYIPHTYLLLTSPYYQSTRIQHNVFQEFTTKFKKLVRTLISYINNRYTIRKTAICIQNKRKRSPFKTQKRNFILKLAK